MLKCSKCKNKFDKKDLHGYKGSVLCNECYPFIIVNGKLMPKDKIPIKKVEMETGLTVN